MGFCSSDTEVDVKLVPNLQPMERITILAKVTLSIVPFCFCKLSPLPNLAQNFHQIQMVLCSTYIQRALSRRLLTLTTYI